MPKMPMNVLLCYPKYPVTFWSFAHALKFINKKSLLPPLGVLTVASMLPKEWNLKLIDLNTSKLRDKDLRWADYVFISAMSIQKESAREIVDRCKSLGAKTVGGGPLFTTDADSFDDVDHIMQFEGEVCMPEFLKDLENGYAKDQYGFIAFSDLEKTPMPKWGLIDKRKYNMLSIQYSRGCPYHCDFCNVVTLFGHKIRTKTTEQVIAELEAIYGLGWRGSIFFVDDNFISNKKSLKQEVLPAMADWLRKRDYPFEFCTQTSINIADDSELMTLMTAAGFSTVFIGIETMDKDSLEECIKTVNKNRDMMEDVKAIQQNGLQVQGGFILGFDSDKPSIFLRMSEFIQKSGIVTAMVGLLNAPKDTKLFARLKKEGRLRDDWDGSNEMGMNFDPKMDESVLQKGYMFVLKTIYSPKNYYERIKIFLTNFRPNKRGKSTLNINHIVAFIKACFKLGIISKGRLEFWKLLRWAFTRGIDSFILAVSFAVYGYHFRKCIKNFA